MAERTPTRDTSTHFLLASALIHKICGDAYYARDHIDSFECYDESFYHAKQADETPELGCALDLELYGTKLDSIIDPVKGAFLEHWPVISLRHEGSYMLVNESHVVFPVSSTWL
jgi:hypothetical protein